MSTELEEYRLLIADVYELAGASRRTSDTMARELGQTAARWHVMSVIDEESLSTATIARRLGLARQSVQRVVDDLGTLGHVVTNADTRDRRAPLVSLTRAGRTSLNRLVDASNADREAVTTRSGLAAENLREARICVRALIDAING